MAWMVLPWVMEPWPLLAHQPIKQATPNHQNVIKENFWRSLIWSDFNPSMTLNVIHEGYTIQCQIKTVLFWTVVFVRERNQTDAPMWTWSCSRLHCLRWVQARVLGCVERLQEQCLRLQCHYINKVKSNWLWEITFVLMDRADWNVSLCYIKQLLYDAKIYQNWTFFLFGTGFLVLWTGVHVYPTVQWRFYCCTMTCISSQYITWKTKLGNRQ